MFHEPTDSERTAVDAEWPALLRLIQRSKGFIFVAYFLDGPAKERLSSLLRAPPHGLVNNYLIIDSKLPDLFIGSAFAQIYSWGEANRLAHEHAPIFIELNRGEHDPAWRRVRQEFFAALNQARSRLELEVGCPLILLLPYDAIREFARQAPDIWHIRLRSRFLTARNEPRQASAALHKIIDYSERSPFHRVPEILKSIGRRKMDAIRWTHDVRRLVGRRHLLRLLPPIFDLSVSRVSEEALDLLAYYFSINDVETAYRLAKKWWSAMEQLHQVRDTMPWLAAAAGGLAEACRRTGDLLKAEELANQGLRRIEETHMHAEGGSERFLTELLYRLGSIKFALGRVSEAEGPLRKSVRMDRKILDRSPTNLHAWQSLLASLNRLGDVQLAKNEIDEALAVFAEARAIADNIYLAPTFVGVGATHVLRSMNGLLEANRRLGNVDAAKLIRNQIHELLIAIRAKPRVTSNAARQGKFYRGCAKLLVAGTRLRFSYVLRPLKRLSVSAIDYPFVLAYAIASWLRGYFLQCLSKPSASLFFSYRAMHRYARHLSFHPTDLQIALEYSRCARAAFRVAFAGEKYELAWAAAIECIGCAAILQSRALAADDNHAFDALMMLAISTLILPTRLRQRLVDSQSIRPLVLSALGEMPSNLPHVSTRVRSFLDWVLDPNLSVGMIADIRRTIERERIFTLDSLLTSTAFSEGSRDKKTFESP